MEQEKPTKTDSVKFWGIGLLLGALILFAVGGYPFAKQIALDGFGLEAVGVVVDVAGADRVKTPIVQFTAADEKQYTFKSYYGSSNIRFAKGEKVQMHYLAANPQFAEIDQLGHINYPSNLESTCLGMILLMGGLISLSNKQFTLDLRRRKS